MRKIAMADKEQIPNYVINGLKAVRATGSSNMLNRATVLSSMHLVNRPAYEWLTKHKDRYMDALLEMGNRLGVNE